MIAAAANVSAAAANVSTAAAKPRSSSSAATADVTFNPAELSLLVDSDEDEDVGDVSADKELGDNAATTDTGGDEFPYTSLCTHDLWPYTVCLW